jgi:hypothetical protein
VPTAKAEHAGLGVRRGEERSARRSREDATAPRADERARGNVGGAHTTLARKADRDVGCDRRRRVELTEKQGKRLGDERIRNRLVIEDDRDPTVAAGIGASDDAHRRIVAENGPSNA